MIFLLTPLLRCEVTLFFELYLGDDGAGAVNRGIS